VAAAQAFKKAVQQGDIWWHAMPHNAELEFMDRSMLQANIQLTHELDKAFGLPPKITMSQVHSYSTHHLQCRCP